MPTKSEQIIDLLASTDLTTREIADVVGCVPAYVRAVQQRLLGGGQRATDKKWIAKFVAMHGVYPSTHKYRTDPDYRARHNAVACRRGAEIKRGLAHAE